MTTVEETLTETAETMHASLNASDRCDRCGAQAYTRWTLGAQDLVMCGHHTAKFEPELLGAGFSLYEDHRGVLEPHQPVAAD